MAWWTWERVTAALVRRLPATVRNVGANGCLLETPVPLAPGTVGLLAIDQGESIEIETVRVCRTTEHAGGTMPFRAGVEFLVLDAGRPSSMRVRALQRAAARVALGGDPRLVAPGENSGAGPTRTSAGAAASAGEACAASGMAMQGQDGSRIHG